MQPPLKPTRPAPRRLQSKKPEWVGASTGADAEGRALYRAAKVGAWQVALGDVVQLPAPEADSDDEEEAPAAAPAAEKKDGEGDVAMGEGGEPAAAAPKKAKMPPAGLVQCLVQDKSGDKLVQVGAARGPLHGPGLGRGLGRGLGLGWWGPALVCLHACACKARGEQGMFACCIPACVCMAGWCSTHQPLARLTARSPLRTPHPQVRMLLPGCETVLGDAASDAELFVTDDYVTVPLAGLPGGCRPCVFSAPLWGWDNLLGSGITPACMRPVPQLMQQSSSMP